MCLNVGPALHSLTFLDSSGFQNRYSRLFSNILHEKRGKFLCSVTVALSEDIENLLWQRYDAGHRYKFEGMERQSLAATAFDSADLIGACQFE